MTVPSLILLHPDDNVLVCVAAIAAGEAVAVVEAIAVGHKVARRPLAAGERVLKYGAPIGSMTRPAARGDWVHMHNMKSDYMPSHTRQTIREEGH